MKTGNVHQLVLLHLYISLVDSHYHHIDQFYFPQVLEYSYRQLFPFNI